MLEEGEWSLDSRVQIKRFAVASKTQSDCVPQYDYLTRILDTSVPKKASLAIVHSFGQTSDSFFEMAL